MSSGLVRIRDATPGDAAEIAPFHVECWKDGYVGLVPQSCLDDLDRRDSVAMWVDRLSRPEDRTIVAVEGDAVVGLVTVGPDEVGSPPMPVELRSLYIGLRHRGLGLGARLVDAALEGRGASLWVFEAARARSFYSRTGWVPTGERYFDDWTGQSGVRLVRPAAE